MPKEKSVENNPERNAIKDLVKGIEKLTAHLKKNKHDYKTKRAMGIKEARLRKLEKYQGKFLEKGFKHAKSNKTCS